jgi:prophage regulatory protein
MDVSNSLYVGGRRIIRRRERKRRIDFSDVHIWRLEKRGEFPKRIQLGPNSVGWFEDEVDAWIASRIRAGGNQPPQLARWASRNRCPTATQSEDAAD